MTDDRMGFATMEEAQDAAFRLGKDREGAEGESILVAWCAISALAGGFYGKAIFGSGRTVDIWPEGSTS